MQFDLVAHLTRQMVWSKATFGPGARMDGVIEHIGKELTEVVSAPDAHKASEWVDVAILALDGLTRQLWATNPNADAHDIARMAAEMILKKQSRNEHRTWPDWRAADPGKAIEHDRSKDAVETVCPACGGRGWFADDMMGRFFHQCPDCRGNKTTTADAPPV
jgi:hypothetical protein